ncbi:MAG: GNAT family N-acetyltransferase [Nitrosomonas sp.]|jgi:GNAT superfamily N-acetyltransferase|uniref:GNAT family N-acetyltransferase n=1 Tax=Nitrosomonas sp. TaxID=42353 RepID=UPI0027271BA4|nr:GNAT family N-acetyltransferase [Nitrosomonas sp.]MBK6959088.1 GNAT family N-acetyltransferase [Nitrosomonas sp.]MDO8894400.1 GNAT family N-acetyltransferase [Nitrosomonas sp.]MDO9469873.1 GNAT family N-acetyltransferase [Nitrosomonas sp.]MDP1549896.1 GNAT family N-acetyltransferase [Nitrosomonas sp.]MDP1788668.1 GNAT family N-acetyltransferase [Nitrosomonas sp.]
MCTNRPEKLKIERLYIHSDYHHKGYGTMLVTDAIDIMQGNNFQLLILAANKHDSRRLFQPISIMDLKSRMDSSIDIGVVSS